MQQQTATLQTAENSSTPTAEAETDSFVDCIHTGYSECSLDASADLRNETSCKENRKYILISVTRSICFWYYYSSFKYPF